MTDERQSAAIQALIFNGITKGLAGIGHFVRLSDRQRIADAAYDELQAAGVEVRLGDRMTNAEQERLTAQGMLDAAEMLRCDLYDSTMREAIVAIELRAERILADNPARCTCPQLDVTTLGELARGHRRTIPGRDWHNCPVHRARRIADPGRR